MFASAPRVQHDRAAETDELHRQLVQVIDHCDQVCSTDITYTRLAQGFVCLVAVMDWYSGYALNCTLSSTLEADFCIEAVGQLLM